jgi:biopolymer transport protein ExbB/TolQ
MAVVTNIENRFSMRFFLVFFKMLMNYLLLNSLITFVIEVFGEYEKKLFNEMTSLKSKQTSRKNSVSKAAKIDQETDFFKSGFMENLDEDYE